MNPARSLAPDLVRGDFHTTWIYLVGPAVGALMYRKNKNPFQKEKRADGKLTLMGVISLKLKWLLGRKQTTAF
ncbi:MAG: aquaporin [Terriglobales bacterium]